MVFRFFLALLALLTGITSAQSAVPISPVQSSVGVASSVQLVNSSFVTKYINAQHFGLILPSQSLRATLKSTSVPGSVVLIATITPIIFIGDRQRS